MLEPAAPEPATPAQAGALPSPGDPDLRVAWQRIQAYFVDDPLASVNSAVGMVGELAETVVTAIQVRERTLRGEWENLREGQRTDQTERLRVLLRDYRELFNQVIRAS